MTFKKISSLVLALLFTSICLSQIAFGRIKMRPEYWHTKFKKKDLENIKKSETYFLIPESMGIPADSLEKMISGVWTITRIKVIEDKDLDKYSWENKSYFRLLGTAVSAGHSKVTNNYVFNALEFRLVEKKGQKKWSHVRLGMIFFTLDVTGRRDAIVGLKTNQDSISISGELLDFKLGYLKNYLQQFNNSIKEEVGVDFYEDLTISNKLKKLKRIPLYVSEKNMYDYNAFTYNERKKLPEDLFDKYEFDYRVISDEELNDRILNEEEDFYYLTHHQKNVHKTITITEGKTGELIYRRKSSPSYNMKPKDLKSISKEISKS